MALYGDVTYDSRVRREAAALARAGYDITIACLAGDVRAPDLPENVSVVVRRPPGTAVIPGSENPFFPGEVGRFESIRRRVAWLLSYVRGLRAWGRLAIASAGPVDAWHAHDLTGLAAVVPHLRPGVPIVYDSHELFLETGTALELPRPARWALRWYERRLAARAAALITVNEAVAAVLQEQHHRTDRVVAVHNCPDRWLPPPERPDLLRVAAAIPAGAPIVLHHGALSFDRGIEQLMEAMLEPGLQEAHLVLMGSGEMHEELVRTSKEARWGNRVHVLEPVLPVDLLPWVSSADVGAIPLQPSTLNLRLSTPNKLFECLAAGTPVVVSDFPAMHAIVDNEGSPLGALCDPRQPRSIAAGILSILGLESADRQALRDRCLRAAAERWNWDHEATRLVSLYGEILP